MDNSAPTDGPSADRNNAANPPKADASDRVGAAVNATAIPAPPKAATADANEAFDAANRFAELSTQVMEFRVIHAAELSAEQMHKLEQSEADLDQQVVQLRAHGIELIGASAAEAANELSTALDRAKAQLDEMASTAKAVSLAGAIVDLAVAVLSRDAKNVLNAAKAIRSAGRALPPAATALAANTPNAKVKKNTA